MNKLLTLFFLTIFPHIAVSKDIPPLTGPVIDQAQILSKVSKDHLSQVLKNYKNKSGNQIQLLIINSLEDEYLGGVLYKSC
jgi:uncharacterized membrane protein YgcG